MTHQKDFVGWHNVKVEFSSLDHSPTFKEREVWWCSIGINIGHEADGKGKIYNRPVLVVRKFNVNLFWGVPLTTPIKDNPYYFEIDFMNKKQCVMLTHLRLYDGRRLTHKMGQMPTEAFGKIKNSLKNII